MSRAVQFSRYGGPEVLSVVEVPDPVPGPGQVRLAVRAAGVNPIDWKLLRGRLASVHALEFPAGLGSDVAGVVEEVGEGVRELAPGDEVARIVRDAARSPRRRWRMPRSSRRGPRECRGRWLGASPWSSGRPGRRSACSR